MDFLRNRLWVAKALMHLGGALIAGGALLVLVTPGRPSASEYRAEQTVPWVGGAVLLVGGCLYIRATHHEQVPLIVEARTT